MTYLFFICIYIYPNVQPTFNNSMTVYSSKVANCALSNTMIKRSCWEMQFIVKYSTDYNKNLKTRTFHKIMTSG